MQRLYRALQRIWKREDGQDFVEYALIAASITVIAGVIFPPAILPAVSTVFSKVVEVFQQTP